MTYLGFSIQSDDKVADKVVRLYLREPNLLLQPCIYSRTLAKAYLLGK